MHEKIAHSIPFDPKEADAILAIISHDSISEFAPTHNGFSFWLKEIPTEIKIVLSINGERGGFNFQTSHSIKTPHQASPYRPSRPWGDDAVYALRLAVTSITQYYREAVNSGLKPEAGWLVSNP